MTDDRLLDLTWSLSKVKQYSALKAIRDEAWNLIKVTTFASSVTVDGDSDVTEKVTTVTFSEGLLRPWRGNDR